MKRILLAAALAALATAAGAQQYKWVDQNGRTQYGDNPPPGVKATRLAGPSSAPAPAAAAKGAQKPLTAVEQDAAFRKRQDDAAKASQKSSQEADIASQRKDQCARAQEYLRSLESGVRIARTDANGERAYLEDDERAAEATKARAMVQQSCN